MHVFFFIGKCGNFKGQKRPFFTLYSLTQLVEVHWFTSARLIREIRGIYRSADRGRYIDRGQSKLQGR